MKSLKKYYYKIAIIGLGLVGSAMAKSFKKHRLKPLFLYDKYKNIGNLQECLTSNIIFLCLPTRFDRKLKQYDKSEIFEICDYLFEKKYTGLVVIKSTVEPETTDYLCKKYSSLHFAHNPEFLTTRTAFKDFHNQKHIVIGKSITCPKNKIIRLKDFYKQFYPEAELSICSSTESESVKIFCNCFYAVKVQFFTELYLLCQNNKSNFDKIKNIMLKNNWINPMHTNVPGSDGEISYGGLCFPKDTNALCNYMIKKNSPNKVLKSTIDERNKMRKKQ